MDNRLISMNPLGVSAFPNPLAHPKIKADKIKWGLPLANAIWTSYQRTGFRSLFGDSIVYDNYLKYAFGEQDKGKYKFRTDGDPNDIFHQFVPRIKDDIKNYATKRIRIAVDKLVNMKYDPIANVTDPSAIDRRKDYQAKLRMSMEQKQFLQELSNITQINQFPEGVNPDQIPVDEDDLTIDIELNYKDRIAMEVETGISYHLDHNDFDAIKEDVDFDLACIGGACMYVGMTENMRPEIKRIRPDRAIVPESDDPYYKNMPYGGFVEYMSVADWRLHHGGEFSKGEEDIIIKEFSTRPSIPYSNNYLSTETNEMDVNTIPIMYFEYKTVDESVNIEFKDDNGNDRFIEKDYDYAKTHGQQRSFKKRFGETRSLHRKPYGAIYKGYWIIGSQYIYRYGPRPYSVYHKQGGRIGDPMIGFIVATPGSRDGRSAGLMKQMIPVLDDLQYDNLKIQEILSNPFPGGIEIDMFALRKATFNWGGKDLKSEDLIKMAFRNKIFIIDSENGNYAAGSNYQAVKELATGTGLADHIALLQQHLSELDSIIGFNQVSSGQSLPERTPVRVAQMQQQSTDAAMGFLFKADFFMFKQLCKLLAGFHLQALKNDPVFYSNIFGEESVEFLGGDDFDPDNIEYGIEIEPRPTGPEWEDFYIRLEKLEQAGKLEASDIIAIKRFTNLKKAGAYMRVLEKRRLRQEAEQQNAVVDRQTAGNAENMKLKSSLIIQEEEAKQKTEVVKADKMMETEMLKHELLMQQIEKRESLTGFTKDYLQDSDNNAKLFMKIIELMAKDKEEKKATDK